MSPARRLAVAAAFAISAAPVSPVLALNDNPHGSAFVVLYRCDGDHWMAIGYPAWNAVGEPPARVSWNGSTVLMSVARSGSGARYTNKDADLEWWNKGREGTMYKLSDRSVILANCRES